MKGYNIVITLLIGIILISMASAEPNFVAKKDAPYNISISCNLNNYFCTATTRCNASLQYPDSAYIINNKQQILDNSYIVINLTAQQLNTYGTYSGNVKCQDSTTGLNGTADFKMLVNAAGINLQSSEGFVYAIMLFVLLIFLCLTLYGSFKIPSKNVRTNEGEIIRVQWGKYARWFCIAGSYLIILWMIYVSWNLSLAFLSLNTLANIFRMLFRVGMIFAIGMIVVAPIMFIISFVRDKKLEQMLERGLTIR